MQHDNVSFWADIKNFEERLAQNPDSYLFARLAEIYLKVGLVDDALHTAKQGTAKYPGFIAGLRALALACNVKGFHDECREALEKVTTALPDDRDSQLLLGRLYSMSGNLAAAAKAFCTLLEFYPDDVECRLELESLARTTPPVITDTPHATLSGLDGAGIADDYTAQEFHSHDVEPDEEEEIIEDLEILEIDEADLVTEEEPVSTSFDPGTSAVTHHDPLSTATLAELYVQQGYIDKALGIYREILTGNPNDSGVRSRIVELEADLSALQPPVSEISAAEDFVSFPLDLPEQIPQATVVPSHGVADNIITILEGWLDNIRRMKACR